MNRDRGRPRQAGFSIAEFMVAIAIGLFLTAGLVGMYITGKASYNTSEANARNQENARFSTDLLTRFLRLADYRTDNEQDTRQLKASILDSVRGCIKDDSLNPCDSTFPGNTGENDLPAILDADTHAIHVKYEVPYDGLRDCTGTSLTKGTIISNTFTVGRANAGDPSALYCDNDLPSTNPQPLVQGVSDLSIRYGVRVGDNMKYVESPSATDWPSVIALRVTVTLNPEGGTLTAEALKDINTDRNYQATVHLRNRFL